MVKDPGVADQNIDAAKLTQRLLDPCTDQTVS